MQGETHTATSATELCPWVEKCIKFAISKGLPKIYPRNFGMTDRSPNRIRTFSEVQIFRTPIYTSSMYHLLLVSGRFSSSQRKRFWNYEPEVLTPILQSDRYVAAISSPSRLVAISSQSPIQRGVSSSFSYECRA